MVKFALFAYARAQLAYSRAGARKTGLTLRFISLLSPRWLSLYATATRRLHKSGSTFWNVNFHCNAEHTRCTLCSSCNAAVSLQAETRDLREATLWTLAHCIRKT